jgi:hypothetical protein
MWRKRGYPWTPETRAVRMQKKLKEKPEGQEIHQRLVSNMKAQLCYEHTDLEETTAQKMAE